MTTALLLVSCVHTPKQVDKEMDNAFVELSAQQLERLGIFIKDTAVMYNNNIEGVGSLDIVIRDKSYAGNASTLKQTNMNFYPRYITTIDTVQRSMYMLSGNQNRSEEEALKWQSFDNLLPVVVQQVYGDSTFGETLVFWMTKTTELERLVLEIKAE
jgi:hypothetical protein